MKRRLGKDFSRAWTLGSALALIWLAQDGGWGESSGTPFGSQPFGQVEVTSNSLPSSTSFPSPGRAHTCDLVLLSAQSWIGLSFGHLLHLCCDNSSAVYIFVLRGNQKPLDLLMPVPQPSTMSAGTCSYSANVSEQGMFPSPPAVGGSLARSFKKSYRSWSKDSISCLKIGTYMSFTNTLKEKVSQRMHIDIYACFHVNMCLYMQMYTHR